MPDVMRSKSWVRLGQRISRRGALRLGASAGIGLAGAALIGCGGETKSTATPSGGGAPTPAGSPGAKAPQPGGTLRLAVQSDIDTFDPIKASGGNVRSSFGAFVYPRFFKFTPGVDKPASGAIEADAIETWEHPDDLTYILHVRKGMKWDRRAPTNGREVKAQDFADSWKYYKDVSFYRADLANDVNKSAAVKDITAVDDMTLKMALVIPDAAVLAIASTWSDLWVLPTEAFSGGYDPAKDWRGAGPFLLAEHRASVSFEFKKNPDYYGAQSVYLDGIKQSIIPDNAQLESQFAAKNVHYGLPPDSVIPLHKQLKGTRIDLSSPSVSGNNIGVSLRPGSVFLDVRVRRAMNMLLDRNVIIDVMSNPKEYEAAGVKVKRYWNTPMNAGYGDFWLDPNGPDFGPSAQYLKHNVAEAKKLLTAANYPFDQAVPLTFTTNAYGRAWPRLAETIMSMLGDGGIKTTANGVDYATSWLPKYLRAAGDIDGIALWPNGARADVGQWLNTFFGSTGANSQAGKAYPELDKKILAQQRISDFKQRVQAMHDIQRYMVENAIGIPMVGVEGIDNTDLSWEGVQNRNLKYWIGGGVPNAEVTPRLWLDSSLRS